MEESLFDLSRSHVSPSHDLGGQRNESPKSPPPHHFFGIPVTYFSNNGIPYYKLEGTFRAYGLDGAIQSGTFNVIYSVDSERDETVFGSYHAISLHFPDRIVQNGYVPPPPETLELDRLTPLVLGRFDGSDAIHSINPATLLGRRTRCIQFETVNGRTRQSNEICVDEEQGNVIRWNVGEDLVDSPEFSAFEGVLPGPPSSLDQRQVTHGGGAEVQRHRWPGGLGGADTAESRHASTVQATPATHHSVCATTNLSWRWTVVRRTGPRRYRTRWDVYQAAVLPNGKPELEAQAVQIVSGWIFSPGVCDGKPIPVDAQLVVHFPPQ